MWIGFCIPNTTTTITIIPLPQTTTIYRMISFFWQQKKNFQFSNFGMGHSFITFFFLAQSIYNYHHYYQRIWNVFSFVRSMIELEKKNFISSSFNNHHERNETRRKKIAKTHAFRKEKKRTHCFSGKNFIRNKKKMARKSIQNEQPRQRWWWWKNCSNCVVYSACMDPSFSRSSSSSSSKRNSKQQQISGRQAGRKKKFQLQHTHKN